VNTSEVAQREPFSARVVQNAPNGERKRMVLKRRIDLARMLVAKPQIRQRGRFNVAVNKLTPKRQRL